MSKTHLADKHKTVTVTHSDFRLEIHKALYQVIGKTGSEAKIRGITLYQRLNIGPTQIICLGPDEIRALSEVLKPFRQEDESREQ